MSQVEDHAVPPARSWSSTLVNLLHWLIPLGLAWVYYCSLRGASWARVVGLANVENYALAVYNQLIWNFADSRQWFQTIHSGYADSWMWSGHRSGLLPLVGYLYQLDPGPIWLTRIQVGAVALGVLPAWGLGRHSIGGFPGGLLGALLYIGFAPLMVIALNDYQDLVLATPLVVLAYHQVFRRSVPGFLLATLALCASREELIVMAPLVGLSWPGGVRPRVMAVLQAGGVALVYGAVVWWLGRNFTGHGSPMATHITDLLTWPIPFTRTAADVENFYQYFFRPVHFLSLLAPATLLPSAGSLFFHLTAPPDGGVDTSWRNHIHHMAPTSAFIISASIVGVGWLFRQLRRLPRYVGWAAMIGISAWIGVNLQQTLPPWMKFMGVEIRTSRTLPGDAAIAPEWALISELPPRARIATDVYASLIVASRPVSYTYDESLGDKAPGKGLSAVDYALIRKQHTPWIEHATSLGWVELAKTDRYVLMGPVTQTPQD